MQASKETEYHLPNYIAGVASQGDDRLEVFHPYDNSLVGSLPLASSSEMDAAIAAAVAGGEPLSRYERSHILSNARALLGERKDAFARLISLEAGLCLRDALYEVGRVQDVLKFSSIEALRDDGQVFSCDLTPHGKSRKIFTIREPLKAVVAITPFNHPLNQVAHKVAPAVAAGAPMILKPSDKTPLSAVRFAELLYEAGLPGWMLSVFVGEVDSVVEPMIRDDRVELVSFTGSVQIGKRISKIAGYKKLCLELGGNSPLIILEDADMDLAVQLAAEGCFRNSGQRCTAVKRLLVHGKILEEFTRRFVAKAAEYVSGDPLDPETRVGTVIDEAAAMYLSGVVEDAVERGAKVVFGGNRKGALLEPTVITDVPRECDMVMKESFGPLAPIMEIRNVDDAIALANGTDFGLSCGIVSNDMERIMKVVKGVRTGTVNVNEVPGYRIESSPFGGVKDSGLGVKEGVIEATKYMTTVKTFSLPW